MIKNNVHYYNIIELKKEIKILLVDKHSVNIFINGSDVNSFKDIILKIHETLGIERELISECNLISQFNDYMSELFDFPNVEHITQVNLVVFNITQMIHNMNVKSIIIDVSNLYNIFDEICKYFENEIVGADANGSRKSFDVYLCEDDFDIEDFKSMINKPSKYEVMERLLRW